MSFLYMVRHGQASFGMPNYDLLSPLGEQQSRALAQTWRDKGLSFHAVISGAMTRHKQTAQPWMDMGEAPAPEGAQVHHAFDEFDAASVWQDQIQRMTEEDPSTAEDLARIFEDPQAFERLFQKAMLRWAADDLDDAIKPSWKQFTARVRAGIHEIMGAHQGGRQVVVFTSAGPISAALQMALDLEDVKAMELAFTTLNASVTVFQYTDDRFSLQGFNNVSHLKDDLITIR